MSGGEAEVLAMHRVRRVAGPLGAECVAYPEREELCMPDEGLNATIRELRDSITVELVAMNRRIDNLGHEIQSRLETLSTAAVNEIRSLGDRVERRLERVEIRIGELDKHVDVVARRLDTNGQTSPDAV